MDPNSVGMLTDSLKAFLAVFESGYGRIHGEALMVLRYLALIDIGLAAIFWLLAREDNIFAALAAKVLTYGFWIWLVGAWVWLAPLVMTGLVQIGLQAGGSTITVAEFTNPSRLARLGVLATEPIWAHIRNYGWNPLYLVDCIISGVLGFLILLAFVWLAIEMYVFLLAFYLWATLASFLVVFGVFRATSWIADGCFSTLLAHGIKAMVLALIASATIPVLILLKLPNDPTWPQMFALLIAVGSIVALSWYGPRTAVAMFALGPQMTAGMFAATAMGGAWIAGTMGHMLNPRRGTRPTSGAQQPPSRGGGGGGTRLAPTP